MARGRRTGPTWRGRVLCLGGDRLRGGGGSGGGGLTGGGWQPKEASAPAQRQQPAQNAPTGGGWQPKTASHTESDVTPERGGGLKGADAKDA